MIYSKYVVAITSIVLFGFGCTAVQNNIDKTTEHAPNSRVVSTSTIQVETADREKNVYTGTYTKVETDVSCVIQYAPANPEQNTFTFAFPCDWDIEDVAGNGFIRIVAPDGLASIKYPGYYISHIDPASVQEERDTVEIDAASFNVLSLYDGNTVLYQLYTPTDGALNTIGGEDAQRDNNNILVEYSAAYTDALKTIIQSFRY
jgi:hypothetical protein